VTTSFGVSDAFIQHGDHQHLMEDAGLTARQMAETILNKMGRAARG